MKRYIFLVLIVITLLLQTITSPVLATPAWERVKVDRVLDNQHVQLFDGRVIRIIGMTPPSLFEKQSHQSCFARPFFRLLKLLIENKTVKIRGDMTLEDGTILPRHVKLENGRNLAEFLLEKGKTSVMTMSKKASFYSKYRNAQAMAKDSEIGIWKGCGGNKDLHERLRRSGIGLRNTPRASFLAPISVGQVKEVLSGEKLLLTNGLKVQMIGVSVPSSFDSRKGFSCFGLQARQHLESLILHKQVFLRRDTSQLNDDGDLLRYVFLPLHDKRGRELFINKQIIEDGYAKHRKSETDKKYEDILKSAQEIAYKDKKGSWDNCLQSILAEK
jgi:endonuclease YncB( thermonuclease family)